VLEDLTRQHTVAPGSNRVFGWVMTTACALGGLAPLRHGLPVRLWALIVAGVIALTAAIRPSLLRPFNVAWTRLGLLLNRVTSPIVLAVVYFGALVPTGWVMRAMGRDPMRRRRRPDASTYWVRRQTPPESMTRQF
jgi:hypothetical protein